jgi:lysophospholipase L1-like esterase
MIKPWLIGCFCFIFPALSGQRMSTKSYTYLALGDSYTIGESLPITESFPYQAVQLLENSGYHFNAAKIVAKTGWTTDELQAGINNAGIDQAYDFVTLLIGVNNQYRGRTAVEYTVEFEALLKRAIHFAGDNPGHVFTLSIPDWGVTPFAADRDRFAISREIDTFNAIIKAVAEKYKVTYIDITPGTREGATDESLLATDKLHPSGKEYSRWAQQLAGAIQNIIKSKSVSQK